LLRQRIWENHSLCRSFQHWQCSVGTQELLH
jgi:hypothetical protein